MSTQPINIPGSPQRQSSGSSNDVEDMLLVVPEVPTHKIYNLLE